ncbi:MAG: TolC family protein, partial [Gemmatimonadaceae bacterium]
MPNRQRLAATDRLQLYYDMRSLHKPFLALFAVAGFSLPAVAQQARDLTLQEALRIAQTQSEAVRIAQAGVTRAQGQQLQARSQYFPQITGSAGYTRTLATQFSALAPGTAPQPGPNVPPIPASDTVTYFQPCTRYLAPGGASDAARVAALELYSRCASSGGGIDFSKAGFGARNQYQLAANGSLTLWSGGRLQAQSRSASAARRSADIELTAQRAQLALDVTQSYFDAVLASRLVAIAESSLVQTEGTLKQTQLARQVGNQSEFELLRAQVTRDNQLPQLLQRRTDLDLAVMRLKQLLNLPYQENVRLTTDIDDGSADGGARTVADVQEIPGVSTQMDTSVSSRAPVRQLEEALRAQQAQESIVKAERLPTISLTSAYSRVAFGAGSIPSWGNWLNNWTVALGASFPIFNGGRIRGEQLVARAGADESRARLDQTRELAALDVRQTLAQLQQAELSLRASSGTAQQASRAYTIAEVRYREGISTQLELSESRLLLEQAGANRATASRNLQVARMRLALLKDLPLGSSGAFQSQLNGAATGAGAGAIGGAAGGGQG